ncbi:hypothetical protein KDL01_26775 [Actinospica durhamensis]|uniref:Uncharacterized protein n=1 Tax=Actinospica durhamensis TaxID=1508375 RepID=A0A941ETB5_9ACTN|nr:hypothetical protein [Actinospica durhamensis]MBR7836911.1 hypothetical protein [Actinospica durhamensis]
MQITEVTDLGVRSAAITMRRDDTPMTFMLYPMLHFASPAFYAEVRRRLRGCAVIVAEGVSGPTLQSDAMDFANRYFPRGRQRGIVAQTDEAVLPEDIPVVRPDVPFAQPALDLTGVPGLSRMARLAGLNLALITNAHLISTALAIAGPRVLCTKDLEIHDFAFTAREERNADTPMAHRVMDARDRGLLAALTRLHEERCREPITVGVVYGAAHMPAVSQGLADRYRYRPRSAQWMTVYVPD